MAVYDPLKGNHYLDLILQHIFLLLPGGFLFFFSGNQLSTLSLNKGLNSGDKYSYQQSNEY
jgi:hypothetical protein